MAKRNLNQMKWKRLAKMKQHDGLGLRMLKASVFISCLMLCMLLFVVIINANSVIIYIIC